MAYEDAAITTVHRQQHLNKVTAIYGKVRYLPHD